MNPYHLPDLYVERTDPAYFDDGGTGDVHSFVSQPDVYDEAAKLAARIGAGTIVDLGCGHAHKLRRMFLEAPHRRYFGVDYGANLGWCAGRWHGDDWCNWVNRDLEDGLPDFRTQRPVLAIACDVIEHLRDPRPLLTGLARWADAVIISTPDRELEHGPDHMGPPVNDCHVREWSKAELAGFLACCGFVSVGTSYTRSDDRDNVRNTILAECFGRRSA